VYREGLRVGGGGARTHQCKGRRAQTKPHYEMVKEKRQDRARRFNSQTKEQFFLGGGLVGGVWGVLMGSGGGGGWFLFLVGVFLVFFLGGVGVFWGFVFFFLVEVCVGFG